MAIFDVVPFSNEVDLLELRLRILDPYVDYFVISEASTTFSGKAKPMVFAESRDKFADFDSKIIYNAVEVSFSGTPFERDRFQKDRIRSALDEHCAAADLVIFSDVDEIPNPRTLQEAFAAASTGRMAHFAQDLFYYYLNLMEISGSLPSITGDYSGVESNKWLGSRVSSFDYLRPWSMTDLRDPVHKETGVRIFEGGWHFSYCGGLNGVPIQERVRMKINDFAHQELATSWNLRRLPKRLSNQKDPFGRKGTRFERVPIDNRFPDYLVQNQSKYSYMILA